MVSTHLKNISQIGSFPQIWMKIKKWNHHLEHYTFVVTENTPLNNRSEVSPFRSSKTTLSAIYIWTQPKDHEIQVKKIISPNKKYVIPQSLKETYFYPQKVKNKNMQSPKSLKKTHLPSPTSFKGQPLADSNQFSKTPLTFRLWREVTKQHTLQARGDLNHSHSIHGTGIYIYTYMNGWFLW